MVRLLTLFMLILTSAPAAAASLSVRLVDQSGRPVSDAVISIESVGHAPPPARAEGTYRIEQRDIMFHPFVSVVPVGTTVSFPNFDATRHQVYSFSPAKRFELKLFARDQSRSIRFDKPGIIAIGCNIHDQMSAFLIVTANGWTARTQRGLATFNGVPAGPIRIIVWHPYLRAPAMTLSRAAIVSGGNQSETIAVQLRPAPVHDMNGY